MDIEIDLNEYGGVVIGDDFKVSLCFSLDIKITSRYVSGAGNNVFESDTKESIVCIVIKTADEDQDIVKYYKSIEAAIKSLALEDEDQLRNKIIEEINRAEVNYEEATQEE